MTAVPGGATPTLPAEGVLTPRLVPRFVPREPPLPATAVAAQGAAVTGLADALRRALGDGGPVRLRVAAADGWLVVLSRDPGGADLPWADGVHWLAHDSGLYLPAHRNVEPHPALVARAAAAHAPRGHTLLALLPGTLLCAVPPERPVTEGELAALMPAPAGPAPSDARKSLP